MAAPPVPLLGPVAHSVAGDRARRLRRQREARRRAPRGSLRMSDRVLTPLDGSACTRRTVGLPDHRDPARATTTHRRGRPLPVRARHLRDAGRVPTGTGGRGRLPRSSSPREHRRGGRHADRGPRGADGRRRAAAARTGARGGGMNGQTAARPRVALGLDRVPRRRSPHHRPVPVRPALCRQRTGDEPPRACTGARDRSGGSPLPPAGAARLVSRSPLASSCSGSVTSTRTATRSCFTATCRSHRSATPRIWRSTRP